MPRVKKWFASIFSCMKQDEDQFSGELVCSYPTLIIPKNVRIPSSNTPAPNVNRLGEKEKKAKDFLDLILLPIGDSVERTDDIPSSENSPQVDTDTKLSETLRNNEEEEYEALSFRQFIFKTDSRKNVEEEAQILDPEDEGFSFWPEEDIAYVVLKQNPNFPRREEEHEEQDDEKSVSLKDLWMNQESENQARKEGADDQIPAERILEEIFQNQTKPMRLSFNGRSTSRSIVMDPSVDFSAGFSIKSRSSSSTSSNQSKKKLRFGAEDCCLSNQIRKADILLSMVRLRNRALKVASSWAHGNAGVENRGKGKAALKTFFSVAH